MAKAIYYESLNIDFQYGPRKDSIMRVDIATMDSDVQCMHCGKNLKKGEMVTCATQVLAGILKNPSEINRGWGTVYPTFCSYDHAKLYATKNNGFF
jgi:hypothetical protein